MFMVPYLLKGLAYLPIGIKSIDVALKSRSIGEKW